MRAFAIAILGCSMLSAALVGCSGSDGATGPAGPDGAKGANGATGATGPAGNNGATGATGAMGAMGTKGADGTPGTNGMTGPTGSSGPTSISLVYPTTGLLGHETDVVVTAQGVTFDATTKVDFGDKVAVSNIEVASPTSLLAHLTIDAAAAIGPRDVKVTAGTATLTWAKAYSVLPPLEVAVQGPKQVGGLVELDLTNRDPFTPFDPSSFTVKQTAGYTLGVSGVSSVKAHALLLIDPGTAPGTLDFSAENDDATGKAVDKFLAEPDAVTLTARTATALTLPADNKSEMIANPLDSNYYSVDGTGPAIISYNVSVSDPTSTFAALGFLYPQSGKVADLLAAIQAPADFFGPLPPPWSVTESITVVSGSRPSSLLLMDQNGAGGFGYALKVTSTPATVVAEKDAGADAHPNAKTAQDITASIPAIITGTLASDTETDVYMITGVSSGDNLEISYEPIVGGGAGFTQTAPANATDVIVLDPSNGDTEALVDTTAYLAHTDTQTFPATSVATVYLVVTGTQSALDGSNIGKGAYTISVRKVPLANIRAASFEARGPASPGFVVLWR